MKRFEINTNTPFGEICIAIHCNSLLLFAIVLAKISIRIVDVLYHLTATICE